MYEELEMWNAEMAKTIDWIAEQANKPKETLVLTSKQAEFLMTYHGASSLTELGQMRNYNAVLEDETSDDLLSAALAECFAMDK